MIITVWGAYRKQGQKRPLDTPKRMIERREREGKREEERKKERYREGGRDKREREGGREGERENYEWELSSENYEWELSPSISWRRKVEIYRDTGVSKNDIMYETNTKMKQID